MRREIDVYVITKCSVERLSRASRKYNVPISKIYEPKPWASQQIKVGDKPIIPSASTATPQAATLQKVWKHWVESREAVYG